MENNFVKERTKFSLRKSKWRVIVLFQKINRQMFVNHVKCMLSFGNCSCWPAIGRKFAVLVSLLKGNGSSKWWNATKETHKVYNIDSSKSFNQTNAKDELFSFIEIISKYREIINRFIRRKKIINIRKFYVYIFWNISNYLKRYYNKRYIQLNCINFPL